MSDLESAAPVAVHADTRYTLLPAHLRIDRGAGVREIALGDPSDPAFLELPAVELDDGRPLRRAVFDVWSDHLRAAVAAGREFEATYRAPRPFATGLAMLGAGCVAAAGGTLLSNWAFRPVPAVDVRPGMTESIAIVFAVVLVAGVITLSIAALVRAWLTRGGSYLHVSSYGIRTSQGARAAPLTDIAAADWHALVRCTRIVFEDGRAALWLPAEPGAMRRVDLLLAALDDRLGEALRNRL